MSNNTITQSKGKLIIRDKTKNGTNMKEIQAWLGHLNYNTTANLYAHLDPSSVNNVENVITNVFSTKKEIVNA